MGRRTRRNHSPGFKAKVALEAFKGEHRLAEPAQHHDVHPIRLRSGSPNYWNGRPTCSAPPMSPSNPRSEPQGAARQDLRVDAGEQFLEGALIKAGMLSVKR